MDKLENVLDRLNLRAETRDNWDVDLITDLKLGWEDSGPNYPESGYYADVGGRKLRLTDGAMKTACRMIKADPKYFHQFEDRNEFPRALIKGIDEGKRKSKGAIVRSDGLAITSILPRDYVVKDAVELLQDFLEPVVENMGDVVGVHSLEEGYPGDSCSYRIIVGNNLIPSTDERLGQYLMWNISTSENGIKPTRVGLGLYRTICTNSAIREEEIEQWEHKTAYNTFYDNAATVIRTAGYFKDRFAAVFGELCNRKLEHLPEDIAAELYMSGLMTKGHFESAVLAIQEPTEDGRNCETEYDLFNAFTRGARDLPSIQSREQAEQRSLRLFTSPGGLREQLRLAAENPRRRGKGTSLLSGSDD